MGIIIKPIISEKMTAITENNQQRYAFLATPTVNKIEMCDTVEEMCSVRVDSVDTCRYDGKRSSHYARSGAITGRKPAFKKALITPQDEDAVDFFSNI